jgi:hypothetical protein
MRTRDRSSAGITGTVVVEVPASMIVVVVEVVVVEVVVVEVVVVDES